MSKKQMIRRRGLCAFLAMAMCFGLLPATAWAVESEDAALIIAAEQDDTDVPAAAELDGTAPNQPAKYRLAYHSEDGKLYKEYNRDENSSVYTAQEDCWKGLDQDNDGTFETLRLNGFQFYSKHKCAMNRDGDIMHPALETSSDSVKLDIEGENVISYDADGNMAYGGVLSTNNTTVTGDGTIRLIATNAEAPRAWEATNGLAVQGNTMPAGPMTVKAVFEVCLEINEENFPDANFWKEMREDLKIYDEDKDGRLSAAEIAKIRTINIPQKGIKDLRGIEHFTSLETGKGVRTKSWTMPIGRVFVYTPAD